MPDRDAASAPPEDDTHMAIWCSEGGWWHLNCACGWKSPGVGYYQRERALRAHAEHVNG